MRTINIISGVLLAAATLISCKPEEPVEPVATKGNVNVKFEYVFGSSQESFELGKMYVHPKTGDSLNFSTFRYYVTNLKLKKDDGTWWEQPESYHLLSAASADESTIELKDIPSGTYTEMEYTMGVDSFMNVSGVYEGDLAITKGMFWDWNTGFIMMKAEGDSPDAPSPGKFALHFGGFMGADNIVTVKTETFGDSKLTVSNNSTPTVTLVANPARLWHNSPGLDSVHLIHTLGGPVVQMATDFYNNIAFKSVN